MLLEKIKNIIKVDTDDFDIDIEDLVEEVKHDLVLSGIDKTKIIETDPLIYKAIRTYIQANFSDDETENKRFSEAYESIKTHLSISTLYKACKNEDD